MHLANPSAIQQSSGLQYTNDHADARWLAHLLRLGLLPEGYIYSKAERAVREVLRKRAHWVRQRTAHMLSVQNILMRSPGVCCTAQRIRAQGPADLARLLLELDQVLAVRSGLAVLHTLGQQILTLEKAVHKSLKHRPAYEQLVTVDGLGTILAQTIVLETGDISRLPTVGHYASSCRCVPRTRMSNGKRKGQGNVQNGNKYLSWASREAAQCAMRYSPKVPQLYQRKQAKTHGMLARKAIAHKLAQACFDIMRDLVPCEATTTFGSGWAHRWGEVGGSVLQWYTAL